MRWLGLWMICEMLALKTRPHKTTTHNDDSDSRKERKKKLSLMIGVGRRGWSHWRVTGFSERYQRACLWTYMQGKKGKSRKRLINDENMISSVPYVDPQLIAGNDPASPKIGVFYRCIHLWKGMKEYCEYSGLSRVLVRHTCLGWSKACGGVDQDRVLVVGHHDFVTLSGVWSCWRTTWILSSRNQHFHHRTHWQYSGSSRILLLFSTKDHP